MGGGGNERLINLTPSTGASLHPDKYGTYIVYICGTPRGGGLSGIGMNYPYPLSALVKRDDSQVKACFKVPSGYASRYYPPSPSLRSPDLLPSPPPSSLISLMSISPASFSAWDCVPCGISPSSAKGQRSFWLQQTKNRKVGEGSIAAFQPPVARACLCLAVSHASVCKLGKF